VGQEAADERSARCHRYGYICGDWELRVAGRCLGDDMRLRLLEFVRLLNQPIIVAFIRERSKSPTGGDDPLNRMKTRRVLYPLRQGNDHRGATWHHEDQSVVWLCAYGRHRSGEPDDAYPYFRSLEEAELLPSAEDIRRLLEDRNRRFEDTCVVQAQALLERARSEPGVEHRSDLGWEVQTYCVIEVVDDLGALWVAIDHNRVGFEKHLTILNALAPGAEFEEWSWHEPALPTRPKRESETIYCRLYSS
jgi:hypothetical protein